MKKRHLLSIILSFGISGAFAQGVWTGQGMPVIYSLERTPANSGTGDNTLNSGSSVSAVGEPAGFLPFPAEGTARVLIGNGAKADLTASDATSKLVLTASSDLALPTKFSVYQVPSASAATSMFFSYTVPVSAATGVVNFIFGNTENNNSNIFNDNSSVSQYYDPANHTLFGAIRLDVYGGDYSAVSFRKPRVGPDPLSPPVFQEANAPSYFQKGLIQNVEFYFNNFTENQFYVRDEVTFTVLPQTFQFWVNGVRQKYIETAIDYFDFPSSKEIAQGLSVNSFAVVVGESSSNLLAATIGDFSIQSIPTATLPVTFTSFSGTKKGSGVQLNFTTSSETDNSHFDILRRTEETGFTKIGRVDTSKSKTYSFYDENPLSGTNYYQIVQVDQNGTTNAYNKIVNVTTDLKDKSLNIVSINNNLLKVAINVNNSSASSLTLTDLSGKIISSTKVNLDKGNNVKDVNLASLAKGIYVITLSSDKDKQSIKFAN